MFKTLSMYFSACFLDSKSESSVLSSLSSSLLTLSSKEVPSLCKKLLSWPNKSISLLSASALLSTSSLFSVVLFNYYSKVLFCSCKCFLSISKVLTFSSKVICYCLVLSPLFSCAERFPWSCSSSWFLLSSVSILLLLSSLTSLSCFE